MSEQIPVTNEKKEPIYINGKRIQPGETRHFHADDLPPYLRKPGGINHGDTPKPQGSLLDILDGNVGQVVEALAGLSSEELDTLEAAEEAGNTRKGVMKAIAEARLALASDGEGTDGEGTDGEVVQESGES